MELLAVEYSKELGVVMCLYERDRKYLVTKGTIDNCHDDLFYIALENLLLDEGRLFYNKVDAYKKLLSYRED